MANELWDENKREMEFVKYWASIDDAEKSVMLSVARSYVQECWRDAGPVYEADSKGQVTHIAIAIRKPLVNNYGHIGGKQFAIHLLTEWKVWSSDPARQLSIEAELYCIAYGYCKYKQNRTGKPAPEFDVVTTNSLKRSAAQRSDVPTTF